MGRQGGETRNLGGGKQGSFFRAPALQAHRFGGRKLPVTFVCLKTKRHGGTGRGGRGMLFFLFFFFFCLKIYVKCIPEVVLGGD